MEPQSTHTLDAARDRAFLLTRPRDALWYREFVAGDQIKVCAGCRSRLFADDWARGCPICRDTRLLHFTRPNLLLATELHTRADGVEIRRPLQPEETLLVRETAAAAPRIQPLRELAGEWLLENARCLLWLPISAVIIALLTLFAIYR